MRTLKISLALVLCLSGGALFPAPALPGRYYRFERLTPRTGANTSETGFSSICQDREGFLWFGTSSGLARYDGYRFAQLIPSSGAEPAPAPIGVYPVLISRSGTLWLGTSGHGLFSYSPETGAFAQYRQAVNASGSHNDDIVLAVQEDTEGGLWVGTRLRGLSRFDPDKGTFSRFPLGPGVDVIWDALADRKGTIWVGTLDAGLFRIDPRSGNTVHFHSSPGDPHSLGSDTVWTVFEDREGTIWAGTKNGGLNRYDPAQNAFVRFFGAGHLPRDLASQTISAIAEDRTGRIWLGTTSDGLRIWDRATGEYVVCKNDPQDPESLGDNSVTSIFEDVGGVIWVGTVRGGLNKCLAGRVKFPHYKHNPLNPQSLSRNDVRALRGDGSGTLWVGLKDGLERFDGTTGRVTRFLDQPFGKTNPGEATVLSILSDSRGRVWLGTEAGGLARLDPGAGTIVRYRHDPRDPNSLSNNKVNALWADTDSPDVLWIGTHQGLNRFDTRTGRWTRYLNDPLEAHSLSGSIITAICGDRAGSLWVGTRWGLNKLDRTTGECERFVGRLEDPPGTALTNNIVHCILEGRDGALWIGTEGGLNGFDPAKGAWRAFGEKEGLAGEVICGVQEDATGTLWISTNRGLSSLDPARDVFRNFGLHDGLQGRSFNPGASFKGADGRMFFGGANGFNAFAPAEIAPDPFVPPVAWTAFRRNNREVRLPRPLSTLRALSLPYKFPLVTFEFAALSFAAPEMNTLVYRLEPRDGDWVPLDPDNSVSLADLGAGRYTLRVKAANPDGRWNDQSLGIAIEVAAPFWRSWWFLLLVAAVVASGAASLAALRKRIRASPLAAGEDLDGVVEAFDLTAREREILRLVLQGASNKDIERRLFISSSTVRNHIYNIYQKLGVRNRLELIRRVARDARKRP
jgi:ligand-binding sensor domain-containing protein/DNA-binding CsgD family transcriptional regulator